MKRIPACLLFALVVVGWVTTAHATNRRCDMELLEGGLFYGARGVALTGGNHFPLDLILARLGLDRGLKDLVGKRVLSVGEGFSELLPYARGQGVEMVGVDPAYPRHDQSPQEYFEALPKPQDPNAIRQLAGFSAYFLRHRAYLYYGTAERLPFDSESYDVVVSHRLANNLKIEGRVALVLEALRVARHEVRIDGLFERDAEWVTRLQPGWTVDHRAVSVVSPIGPAPAEQRESRLVIFTRQKHGT